MGKPFPIRYPVDYLNRAILKSNAWTALQEQVGEESPQYVVDVLKSFKAQYLARTISAYRVEKAEDMILK